MELEFKAIDLRQQKDYMNLLALCPIKFSDISFINLWAWAEEYGLVWARDENLVWIRQTRPEACYWPPVGPWEDIDWQACIHRNIKRPALFTRMPDQLVRLWENRLPTALTIEDTRDHWDYLYLSDELIELKGSKLHKKKNLLNQFKKGYDFTYRKIDTETIELTRQMQQDWCTWRDCESSDTLAAENRAIERVLTHWEIFEGIAGGCISTGNTIIAYTVAERLTDDTVLIHFEKADPNYKGAYQAINQMFLEHSNHPFSFVNREQDLGDPGLRKAKLSYVPAGFVHKFRVVIRES